MASLEELRHENDRLNMQVRRLIRAESRLYSFQEELEHKRSLFRKISAVGTRLNDGLSRANVLRVATECIVVELCFERCVVLEGKAGDFRICCHEGYYEPDTAAAIESLPMQVPSGVLAALRATQPLVCSAVEQSERYAELCALGRGLLLERFFVFALTAPAHSQPEDPSPCVLLLIGGSEERARFHAPVGTSSDLLPILSILLSQTAAALRNANLFAALLDERNSLEHKVEARTAELSRKNEELKAALEQARESERVKMEFLANISHELRTPLNSIINIPDGLLEYFPQRPGARCTTCQTCFELEDGDTLSAATTCPACQAQGCLEATETIAYHGEPAETRQYLQTIVRCGSHLLDVVNDILDASRLAAGRIELHIEVVRLSTVMENVRQSVGALAARRGLRLLFPRLCSESGGSEGQTLQCDGLRLAQILINLLSNAIKFSNEGGTVRLGLQVFPEAVRFEVADDGIGIAPENQERIFESFRQVEGGHTRRFGGSGLGLAITRQLVQLHNGRVWVESALGQGSKFIVELPSLPGDPR